MLIPVLEIVTRKDRNKLIAADTVNRGVLECFTYDMAASSYVSITGRVSEIVIDILKAVDVHHNDRKLSSSFSDVPVKLFDFLCVCILIADTCKSISVCLLTDLSDLLVKCLYLAFFLRNVLYAAR